MSNKVDSLDVVIIGGGLAGLTTAALLARSGKVVTLFEQSSKEIGGRARTTVIDGFHFNQAKPKRYAYGMMANFFILVNICFSKRVTSYFLSEIKLLVLQVYAIRLLSVGKQYHRIMQGLCFVLISLGLNFAMQFPFIVF